VDPGRSIDGAAALIARLYRSRTMNTRMSLVLIAAVGMAGCASIPSGPDVMALPGTGMSFEQFRADDYACQGYARQATGLPPTQQAATDSAVNSGAVGTAVGAAAGALIGAASGNVGAGAAIGAGGGLLVGSAAGTDAYGGTAYNVQQRYDNAYVQCMYAKGHQVPVPANVAEQQRLNAAPTPAVPYPGTPAPAAVPAYPPANTPPPPGY
jgi:hypothetical protein